MLYARESTDPIDVVCQRLEAASAENKFGVLGIHNLKEKMKSKGVDFPRECRIFEVCNPHKAKTVLEADMSVSTALPCRISVYEEDGKTKVAMLKPIALMALFGRDELRPVAEEVERTMERIIDSACGIAAS